MSAASTLPLPMAAVERRQSQRWAIARHFERSARLWALVWGGVFGIFVLSTVKSFIALYPTAASRIKVAGTLQAFSVLLGPPRHIETVAGFATWRVLTAIAIIGAIWGLRTSTGLLRGQEDVGQWELLLAGPTTRRWATGEALIGLGMVLTEMFLMTALLTVSAGSLPGAHFGFGPSLLFAGALVAAAAMFLAIGAVASQLSATRGQAATISAIVLGGSFLVRLVADSRSNLGWLRWLSPVGWLEELRPLRDTQPLALVPIVATIGLCSWLTLLLAGRRDLQAGILDSSEGRGHFGHWLVGPTSLAVRLATPGVIAWLAGIAALSAVYGLLTRSTSSILASSPAMAAVLGKLGAHRASLAFLGVMFLMYAMMLSVIACLQIASMREEEASGRLDNLLVQPVRRLAWLVGRIAIALVLVVLAGFTAGFFTWFGAASQHSGIALSKMLEASLNALSPAIFVLGAGVLAFGLRPHLCSVVCYGIVGWSFLMDLLGSLIRGTDWLRDSSLFTHMTLAPAAAPDWGSAAIIIALGVAAGAVGAAAFQRRDVEYA